jgi:prepilin peptidase CpaA
MVLHFVQFLRVLHSKSASRGAFMLMTLSTALFPLLMIVAAAWDVLSRRIPNPLVLVLAALFLPFAWVQGMPVSEMLMHLVAGLAVLMAGYVAFALGYLGGGDAKLMGAAALWVGLSGMPQFLVLTVLAGGILALGVLLWSILHYDLYFWSEGLQQRLAFVKPSVPYGFAIAAGAILSVPGSWLDPTASISTWLTQI